MHTSHAQRGTPANRDVPARGPMDGELMDLYIAILIVVPLSFLLKSLWF